MYSRHRCFSSMFEFPNPCIHSSRNSSVRWGSLAASVSLMDLMKMVLLAGIHKPVWKRIILIINALWNKRAMMALKSLTWVYWPNMHHLVSQWPSFFIRHYPSSNTFKISIRQTFWPSFMSIGLKMWPLQCTKGFSKISSSDLILDLTITHYQTLLRHHQNKHSDQVWRVSGWKCSL